MSIAPGALSELHRILRQLTDLRDRLARGPKQVAASEANVKRAEIELTQAKDVYKKARIASDEKQLQLKTRESRIKDLQTKLNQSESNREYQAFKEQIAADEKASSVLSDEILEGLEQLDVLQAKIVAAESGLSKGKDELQKVRTRVSEQQQGLETELARLLGELAKAEVVLPPDFKRDYDRVTKTRGEDALSQVEADCCGNCCQVLTPQTMNDLYLCKPVSCKSCGALLYLTVERSAAGQK